MTILQTVAIAAITSLITIGVASWRLFRIVDDYVRDMCQITLDSQEHTLCQIHGLQKYLDGFEANKEVTNQCQN